MSMSDSPATDRERPSSDFVKFRLAAQGDAEGIASLHADSWRRHYRGAYLDSYLDGDVVADRLEVWRDRLAEDEEDRITIVADRLGYLVGFAHLAFDQDPTWGSLLDNLHVVFDQKRHGIGTLLLSAVASELIRSRPSGSLYLWVLDQNEPAQAFYTARGGVLVESELRGPFPGGGQAIGHRYAWSDPSRLVSNAHGANHGAANDGG
jgi:GNAT superfamily N-acetyltransferase